VTVGDFESRLRSRLEHVGLSAEPHFLRAAERYYSLLGRWNATTNLTALALEDFPARTLDRLFVEPLQAAELVEDSPLACVDVGSGGGSPSFCQSHGASARSTTTMKWFWIGRPVCWMARLFAIDSDFSNTIGDITAEPIDR